MLELLSPAGGKEALDAAIESGADAVYLGLSEFSARAGAENFDKTALRDALNSCRRAGVKVYVTLNTLLHDRQLEEMEHTIRFLAESAVDGIIVQDLATAAIARSIAPEMPLHGSTQMCVYSPDGAKALEQMGFKRVVLARELSLAEIQAIVQSTSMEIEIFVHGALCMCYSGHCYFSAVVGRNSGNRGRCAQPCRLPYDGGYPLSLKDLSLISYIDRIREAGITSLKIEGRLKSPVYVGAVTAAFRDALDGKAPDRQTIEQLQNIFSRDGFTDGYFTDRIGPAMFGTKKKTEYADYKAAVQLHGQRNIAKRFTLNAMLIASIGAPARWTFYDGQNTITFEGDIVSAAQNKPLDRETLAARLDKLTDTHYRLGDCQMAGENAFLPVSAINEARRKGCALLDDARAGQYAKYPTHPFSLPQLSPQKREGRTQVLYHNIAAFSPSTDHTPYSAVWLPAGYIRLYQGENRGAIIDHFYPADKLDILIEQLKRENVRRVLVGNIGHIAPFMAAGMEVWGDYALNITNSLSLAEYQKMGLQNACLSFELSLPQVRDMVRTMPTTLICYGRLPLMTFKNCVISQRGSCINHTGFEKMRDRKGHTFLLSCRPECGNTLFNSIPLYLESHMLQGFEDIDKRYDFTDETPAQVRDILHKKICGETPDGQFTKGLYARGVI